MSVECCTEPAVASTFTVKLPTGVPPLGGVGLGVGENFVPPPPQPACMIIPARTSRAAINTSFFVLPRRGSKHTPNIAKLKFESHSA